MARQTQLSEWNKFSAGLITDGSPLNSPENSSLDEDNMVLNIDGSRNRRLGLDYEIGNIGVFSPIPDAASNPTTFSSYRWDNAGGETDRSILVVQYGRRLVFFRLDGTAISSNYFYGYDFAGVGNDAKFSFATVDGALVVVNGDKIIYIFEYTYPSSITVTQKRLKVRDLFGVEDIWLDTDTTRDNGVLIRPAALESNHLYNLRNQSWAVPRLNANTEDRVDPITAFFDATTGYPSNGDTVTESLYADPADTDNRTVDRFFPLNLYHNPIGSARAAQGYFVIDALDRGPSRVSEMLANDNRFPDLDHHLTSLPEDSTKTGAVAIAEFAGRIWYAGFSGENVSGDSHSPKMSSYLLFSRVVDNINDINLCYQDGDPTSKFNADIVDTDGGFIRFNEAYGIHKLISLGSSLFVIASNGIWRVHGGSDNGFTATTYIVERITDRGCDSPESIVKVDNTFMYWGDDSIYHVTPDQFGNYQAQNITFGRIQRFYNSLSQEVKRGAHGVLDSYEKKVRWVFHNRSTNTDATRELVLDLQIGSYSTNTFGKLNGNRMPKVIAMYTGRPYSTSTGLGSEYKYQDVNTTLKEAGYIVMMTADGSGATFAFATYRDKTFRDFKSMDGVGVDAEAFLITSYLSGEDFQRDKQVTYMTTHLRRTETGYNSDMSKINTSSCIVQARWGWSNNDQSGKWGREFQAYRYRQLWLPQNSGSDVNNGFDVISTKSKLRGSGKVLSLKFRTEPDKDLHIYGWSLVVTSELVP